MLVGANELDVVVVIGLIFEFEVTRERELLCFLKEGSLIMGEIGSLD